MGFDKQYCLCGVHVHTATRAIAIVFLVFAVLDLVIGTAGRSLTLYNNAGPLIFLVLMKIFALVPNVLLLVGNSKRRPNYYWPFIIMNIIAIIFTVILAGAILIFGGAFLGIVEGIEHMPPPDNLQRTYSHPKAIGYPYGAQDDFPLQNYGKIRDLAQEQHDYEESKKFAEVVGTGASIMMIGVSIFLFLLSALYTYLLSVVIRSYQHLKEMESPETYNKLIEELKFAPPVTH